MPGTNEAFSRVKIDAQLKDQGWDVLNPNAVRFEYVLPDKTKADYVLCDRHGRALAVIEAKRAAINPAEAEVQAKAYAAQLKVPYVFLANGEEIRFWEWQREAFPRAIKTFFSQGDLERRAATGHVRRDSLAVAIDKHIVARIPNRVRRNALPGNRRRKMIADAYATAMNAETKAERVAAVTELRGRISEADQIDPSAIRPRQRLLAKR